MQCDVNVREEAELRRLENGSQVGGDVMLRGDAAEPPVVPAGGAVVSGAVQRSEEISSKLFENGGFRDSANIVKLLPRGGAGLKAKVPKRYAPLPEWSKAIFSRLEWGSNPLKVKW